MAKLPTETPGGEPQAGKDERPRPDAAIRNSVMTTLGVPPGLFRVAVMPLWRNYYRVNVLIGPDATSVLIAHSYFLEVGAAGDIISATPRITRLYD